MTRKILIYFLIFCLFISTAFAVDYIFTVDAPTQASPSSTFDINVSSSTSGVIENYLVAYTIDISGGCLFNDGKSHLANLFVTNGDISTKYSVSVPSSSNSCTLTGDYQYALVGGIQDTILLQSKIVTIAGQACTPTTCSTLGYICSSPSDGCGGTLNCGTCSSGKTCSSGTCVDTADPCSECTDWANIGCIGTAMKQVRNCPSDCDEEEEQYVADSSCETTSKTSCEFYEQTTEKGCETAGWIYIIGGLIGVVFLFKIMGR